MSADEIMTRLNLTLPLLAPDQLEPMRELLDHATSSLDIACVNLPLDEKGGGQSLSKDQQQQQSLIAHLQKKNIAVLADITSAHYASNRKSFEKDLENARKMGYDGLHMTADAVLFERAREVLGADAIIGVDCTGSRHAAMQLGELGADYVGFASPPADQDHDLNKQIIENNGEQQEPETVLELVNWWQQLFEVPCVALNIAEQSKIEDLLGIPADFIAVELNLSDNTEFLTWLATKCPVNDASS